MAARSERANRKVPAREQGAEHLSPGAVSPERLSRRQRDVVALIGLGLDNAEIAEALDLTPDTVANHVQHVFQRLSVESRAEVATWAAEHGLTAGHDRLLTLLERLLEIEATSLDAALEDAAQLIAEALATDKVDIFLHDPATQSLVARGASRTPLGRKQGAIGMDRQPLANGGRAVEVFLTGEPYLTGHAERDARELVGVTQGLGIRSEVLVPFEVAGERRGVLAVQAEACDTFSERDLRFLRAVARWVGSVAHRAELLERTAEAATEQGRRAAAEDLVMVVAHDLRNHLAPVRGRADLIHHYSLRKKDAETTKHAEALQRSLMRFESMIADLLDVARLEHGLFALVPRETDLAVLIHETSARFRSEQKEVRVESPEHLCVWVDPDRIRQALENLLANAIRHTPEGTYVEVSLRTERRQERDVALIRVADQGPGLPPELVPRLFERFATDGRSSGLGLGLYLAHRIATAHAGALEVESARDRGTSFTLSVPLGSSTGPSLGPPATDSQTKEP